MPTQTPKYLFRPTQTPKYLFRPTQTPKYQYRPTQTPSIYLDLHRLPVSIQTFTDSKYLFRPTQTPSIYLDLHRLQYLPRPELGDWQTQALIPAHTYTSDTRGSDGAPLRFIKNSLPVVSLCLATIVNTLTVTVIFPTSRKHSVPTPTLKTGDVNDPGNYPHLSLLPLLSQLLETLVSSQLSQHLESNHLLSNTQHGFRQNLSTTSALLTLTKNLCSNMDNKKVSLIILCGLSKAADSVSHMILLKKITQMQRRSLLT